MNRFPTDARYAMIDWSTKPLPPMRYEVRYQAPYSVDGPNRGWRSQWFNTLVEAERMVEFYHSCGSPAHIAPSSLAQLER